MNNKKNQGFTLIELLVVISIIAIVSLIATTALFNARAKSRDAKRVGNIRQIQTALDMFYNDRGRYPTSDEWASGKISATSTNGTTTYMQVIPLAPTPADGTCDTADNEYDYTQRSNGSSYTISFCIGGRVTFFEPGLKCLAPGGIVEGDCN